AKAAEAVREVVSMAILTELQDPRVKDVTVTKVEVTPDMRQAKVYVSVMGAESKQQLSLRGLQNAAGFLQSKVARRIDTRYTPRLEFVLDQGVKKSIAIAEILKRVLPKDEAAAEDASAATNSDASAASANDASSDDDDASDSDTNSQSNAPSQDDTPSQDNED
ncbi:MAG TPA: 30S ribosome-binding factor RbfA, partial [Pirellulales bacterium]|nr:30S ribosome-binding factor RbfA [Pirellulales bacterium]